MISIKRLLGIGACIGGLAIFSPAAQNQASILNDRGLAAAAHGDYAQAEQYYRQALESWRSLGPNFEPHAATTMLNLGEMFCNSGKWHEGVDVLEQALIMNRRSPGPKHLRTVSNLSWLGHAYLQLGDLDRAEPVLAEALAIERELYPDAPVVGHTLLGMSLLRKRQHRYGEALDFGEQAIDAAMRSGGEISAAAAMAYENVAVLHRRDGRPERALPLFRKARFIYEKTLGAGSAAVASLESQEGLALLEDGKPSLADQEMSEAAEKLAALGVPAEFRLAIAETNLGRLRILQKKYDDAERVLTDALSIEERMPTRPTSEMAATVAVLAQLRKAQKRGVESSQLMTRALGIESGH